MVVALASLSIPILYHVVTQEFEQKAGGGIAQVRLGFKMGGRKGNSIGEAGGGDWGGGREEHRWGWGEGELGGGGEGGRGIAQEGWGGNGGGGLEGGGRGIAQAGKGGGEWGDGGRRGRKGESTGGDGGGGEGKKGRKGNRTAEAGGVGEWGVRWGRKGNSTGGVGEGIRWWRGGWLGVYGRGCRQAGLGQERDVVKSREQT